MEAKVPNVISYKSIYVTSETGLLQKKKKNLSKNTSFDDDFYQMNRVLITASEYPSDVKQLITGNLDAIRCKLNALTIKIFMLSECL